MFKRSIQKHIHKHTQFKFGIDLVSYLAMKYALLTFRDYGAT